MLLMLMLMSVGIFEDKVANFWYCASVVYDFRRAFASSSSQQHVLLLASLALTACATAPVCVNLLRHKQQQHRHQGSAVVSSLSPPSPPPSPLLRTCLALVNCSLAFFLFSFQVHEKSILLPLVPASFLIREDPWWVHHIYEHRFLLKLFSDNL